jgi:hypothetical protein
MYRMIRFFLFLLLALHLSSCEKYYLSLQQQWVDISYLASSQANTPDPRKQNPPLGQMLIIDWRVSKSILKLEPHIALDLIFWDYSKKTICFPMKRQMDYVTYELLNDNYEKTEGILTYRAKIITKNGEAVKESKHQLWVDLIQIEED